MSMLNTFQDIVGDVHAHALGVDSLLCEGWVRDTWMEIQRARTWSHLRRQYQIVIPAPYTTGTATFTPGSQTVTIAGGGVVSAAHIGRQLQRAVGEPFHDIVGADTGANTYTIFPEWNFTTTQVTAQSFRVFTAYIAVPADFFAWMGVRDPERRRRLHVHVTQDMLDRYDPKRTYGTRPYCFAGVDWTRAYSGRVYSTLLITQSAASPTPIAGGVYNGQYDGLLVLRITGTGALDAATFSWAMDAGTPESLTVSSSGNVLPNGVSISWPTGTYTSGTVYAVRVSTNPTIGGPRYEIYPHPTEAMVLVASYSTRPQDIESDGWTVPMPLTGDIIALGAKDHMARYPGTAEKKNPYTQIARSTEFRDRFEQALLQAETMDDYIIEQNVFESEEWPYFGELARLPWSQTEDYSQLVFG